MSSQVKEDYPPPTKEPAASYTLRKSPWQWRVTPFEDILNHRYEGSGSKEEPFLVEWLPHDPENPQTWTTTQRWITVLEVSTGLLAVTLSSSGYTGGFESASRELHASTELLTAGVSLMVVGFAFGPLLWAPAGEVWGRRPIYIISFWGLALWQAVSAASQTVAQLLVFRFLAGFFGSAAIASAGASITDVLPTEQLGLGYAIFAAAPFLGPALGPLIGGFIGITKGWRWVQGVLGIFSGAISIMITVSDPETYAPVILRNRATRLSKATGKNYWSRTDAKQQFKIGPLFRSSLIRPWKFLFLEPIVLLLTLYTAVIYGVMYLNFAAYPIIFSLQRGWNAGIEGLAFMGILIGSVISVMMSIWFVNPRYIKVIRARGHPLPEDRLPPAIWGGVLIVIGLAGFAATDGPDVHWSAPIIFGIPFGMGIIVVFLAVLGYLIESYTIYAASVMAANSVLRSLTGAAFPLFTPYMYRNLGVHWAAALPGFIAAALVPVAWVFMRYGETIRAKCKYSAEAQAKYRELVAARQQAPKRDEESNETSEGPVAEKEVNLTRTARDSDEGSSTGVDEDRAHTPQTLLGSNEDAGGKDGHGEEPPASDSSPSPERHASGP